jgi:hypothetical protein
MIVVAVLMAGVFGLAICGAFAFLGYVAWDEFGATWFGILSWAMAAAIATGTAVVLAAAT